MVVEETETQNQFSAQAFYERYELKEVLGKGLSSVVKRCVEKLTGQAFACKIIEYPDDGTDTKEATHNEISILRIAGQHPNIIAIHEAFEMENCAFIVMEFCAGGELFDYLTKVVRLSEKKARIMMRSIVEALQHLHRHNVVHRDLKPENILLDEKSRVKITDLGLSVILGPDQQLEELCGTVGYMAPEVLLHSIYPEYVKGYGKPVDLWACGVILYTMLSGVPPFWHRKQNILLRLIMDGKYSFDNIVWEEISDDAKNLISSLLVVDPVERMTAEQALNHKWFTFEVAHRKGFVAKRVLKAHIIVVWSIFRMRTLHASTRPVTVKDLVKNPYKFKNYRKVIDYAAFDIYAHWVKKAGNQNRAALFESVIRDVAVEA